MARAGETVAVVGPRGAGKSTLLLCAAGLLKPESGDVRWFGEPSSSLTKHRVAYHWTPADFVRTNARTDVGIHLLDFELAADWPPRIVEWIETRRDRGDAVVLATRDEAVGRALASRVLFLRAGRFWPMARRGDAVSRVAEPVA